MKVPFGFLLIDLTDDKWCLKHLEWMQANGTDMPMAASLLVHMLLYHDEPFRKLAGGKTANIQPAIESIKPVCCYLGDRLGGVMMRSTVHIN